MSASISGGHHGLVWRTVSVVLLGAMFAHAVELQHQALHNTGFKSKLANRIVGILLGIPMLISFTEYQTSHLHHHRTLGTPADRESFDYDYTSLRNPVRLLLHLLMLRHYLSKSKTLLTALLPAKTQDRRAPRVKKEYQLMLGILTIGLFVSIASGTTAMLWYWLLPLFAVAAPLHVLIELPEHLGCNPAARDLFANTRTIRTSRVMTWFVNGNNYHVEHHWRAGIQVENWHKLHAILRDEITFFEPSYLSFYWRFLQALWRGRVHDPAYWATRNGVTERTAHAFSRSDSRAPLPAEMNVEGIHSSTTPPDQEVGSSERTLLVTRTLQGLTILVGLLACVGNITAQALRTDRASLRLVYAETVRDTTTMWSSNPTGDDPRRIYEFSHPDGWDGRFSLSPDGTRIAFNRVTGATA